MEYEQLWKGARSQENQTRLDALLLTGLRYVEAQRLQENPDWLDGKFVHLPEYAQKKVKRQQRERWIRLSDKGRKSPATSSRPGRFPLGVAGVITWSGGRSMATRQELPIC